MAAVQAEGCYFDLPASVEKTCRFIEEAASKGCDLIAFPELWIPMYPGWIWYIPYYHSTVPWCIRREGSKLTKPNRQRPIDFEMVTEYMKNSLRRDSVEMDTIRQCAASNNISVVLGYSENDRHSLYLSQSIIGRDGEIKMHRRKIKPTHAERTIFGDGSGASLMNVVDEPTIGKVGTLSCWEHSQPLLRYHTYSQGEQVHIAAWPPMNYYSSFPPQSALWSQCREGV